MGNQIIKKILKLEGVTCTACESKIETKLQNMVGVIEAKVSYKTSILEVTFNADKVSLSEIIKTLETLDYGVEQILKDGSKKEIAKEISNTKSDADKYKSKYENTQLAIIGIIILGIYLIIGNTIGFNFFPEVNANMGYGILFVVGLLTSLHCVAMCGGINLSVCVSYKVDKENTNKFSKFLPSLMYNAGRVISYTVLGGIVGALGSVFSISLTGSAVISIAAGAFMIIMGLNMLNIFPWLRRINPHMPKIFARKINSEKNNKGPFVVGLLNGLMPCGPLQAMQLYALGTGSFLTGAFSMFIFSLGTVPLLFTFGAIGSMLSSKYTKKMLKVSAILVVFLGLIMINRGFAFTGFTMESIAADYTGSSSTSYSSNSSSNSGSKNDLNSSSNGESNQSTSVVNGNVQEIKTTLQSGQYTPITVQVGVPVKWTIVADSKNLNGCNNQIIIPKYGIKQKLVAGENVITFTPTDTGSFGYSCWMGMIRSSITVVDKVSGSNSTSSSNSSNSTNNSNTPSVDNSGLPAGCCGVPRN